MATSTQAPQCKDPRVVTKYNQILWELLHTSSMATRAQVLAKEAKTQLTQMQQNGYEIINKAAMEYQRHVKKMQENQCQSNPVVPASIKSHQPNFILEGSLELDTSTVGSSIIKQ